MRISPQKRPSVRRATEEVAGSGARALLFGSRVQDDRRGGDIDLLVARPAPADRIQLNP
jgi:predicted nucleotidyltransferase